MMGRIFSVIIAEDEIGIRRELEEIIKGIDGFQIACAVSDGQGVLDYLETNACPDILLTDIRMPGMDGLTLLPILRGRYPKLKTIIISGFNNFDYAQKAIKYGVSDYLLKPIAPAACISTLEAVAKSISRESYTVDLNSAISRHNIYPQDLGCEPFLIAIRAGFFPYADDISSNKEEKLISILNGKFTQIISAPQNGIIYLLPISTDRSKEPINITDLYETICKSGLSAFFTLLYSSLFDREDLYSASERLKKQMRLKIVPFRSAMIDLCEQNSSSPQDNPYVPLIRFDHDLSSDLVHWNADVFKDELHTKLKELLRNAVPCDLIVNRLKYQYVYTAQRISAASSVDTAPIPYDWEQRLNTAFTISTTESQLLDEVLDVFSDLYTTFSLIGTGRNISHEIACYIENNYEDRITNQSLAKQFGFVPSYISHIFKEYKGISPCDYLTEVRIRNACRIIRNSSSINFSELAVQLGFSDSSYFSKIFKKQTGLTPSEYRLSSRTKR